MALAYYGAPALLSISDSRFQGDQLLLVRFPICYIREKVLQT